MRKIFLLPFTLLPLISLTSCDKKNICNETKIAVFADVQLNNSNTGIVSNSYSYLRNHLALCKENNVDVIMISGDLVNNAYSNYYDLYEEILQSVYGKDEKQYPEFVYTMGNHEWYASDERQDEMAVYYYNKHARINTDALVKRSIHKTDTRDASYYGNFYKVINGIPFMSISTENLSGSISYKLREEIKSWLDEISQLKSVKNGGPIFVSYHYAFEEVTYSFGQGGTTNSQILYNLLKDYPQVILFSGDTHFSGVNERTINQVDFTDINLGSSSYTRHVERSCLMDKYDTYYNIESSNGSKDLLTGQVSERIDETPHIHFVDVKSNGDTYINRYFSTNDSTNPTHIGMEWKIPVKSNKDNFIYTSDRYGNKDWAYKLYGKEGLEWDDSSTLSYNYSNNKLFVQFPDVTDYNACEHYRIKIYSGEDMVKYDVVSQYINYDSEPHFYNYEIDDVGFDAIDKIEVYAYDFFDNVSTNYLEI